MNAADVRRRAYALQTEGDRAKGEGDRAAAERSLHAALSEFVLLEDTSAACRVLVSLADLSLDAGDFGAATELGRQAVERTPGDVEAVTGLANVLWRSGSLADAEATFGQALRNDRSAVRALAGRGQVRVELGDGSGALADLDRALEIGVAPADEADVWSARAVALAGLGRTAEAAEEIAAALETSAGRPRTRARAAWVAALAGRAEEAEAELGHALDLGAARNAPAVLAVRRLLAEMRPRD